MPLDAICLQGVVGELAPRLTGSRIEKIQQPARDQVILLLRGSRRLLLNAGAGQPRLHLTEQLRDNPSQPPMFCMLLRKHLSGGVIESIRQEPLERVVTLTVLAADELGERSRFTLVWEGMPRRANLILCDRDGRIIDCLRRIDLESGQDRQVLPGLFYHLPMPLDKLSLLSQEEDSLALAQRGGDAEQAVDKWVLDHYTGISPLIAREFAFRAGHETDVRFGALNDVQREALVQEFSDTANAVKAPLPGTITSIEVAVGQEVKAGDTVVVLEAMKMQNNIEAETSGTITGINVNKGDAVMEGDTLVTIK